MSKPSNKFNSFAHFLADVVNVVLPGKIAINKASMVFHIRLTFKKNQLPRIIVKYFKVYFISVKLTLIKMINNEVRFSWVN